MESPTTRPSSALQRSILLLGILLVAFNLRPAITALSPLAERLQNEGLSREVIGLLSTIPLLLFAVVGFWAGWIGSRLGLAKALGGGLLILGVGAVMRSIPGSGESIWMWTGTALIGAGIAMGNVLLPGLVKERYPDKVGVLTSLYSTALNFGAAAGIALAVPLADFYGGSWRWSLAVWGIVALASTLFWVPEFFKKSVASTGITPFSGIKSLIKKTRAWHVAIFTGLQSTIFYSSMIWLPTVLQHRGLGENESAMWATAMQVLGCVASFVMPTLAARSKSQSVWLIVCGAMCTVGLAGILWFPASYAGLGGLILGYSLNSCFALGLMILALRSKTPQTAAALSSMAQAFGYLIAAPGPWLVGKLSLTSGGWTAAFGFLILISLINVVMGGLAGRSGEIDIEEK